MRPKLALTLLLLLASADALAQTRIIVRPPPPPPAPTTSCAATEQKLNGPNGAVICVGHDGNNLLSYAYSVDPSLVVHQLNVSYPAPAFSDCQLAQLDFAEGTSMYTASTYLTESIMMCGNTNPDSADPDPNHPTIDPFPIEELVSYNAPGTGTYTYNVHDFSYNGSSSTAHVTASFQNAAGVTSFPDVSTWSLNSEVDLSGFYPDVTAFFPSQLARSSFFDNVYGVPAGHLDVAVHFVYRHLASTAAINHSGALASQAKQLVALIYYDFTNYFGTNVVDWNDLVLADGSNHTPIRKYKDMTAYGAWTMQ